MLDHVMFAGIVGAGTSSTSRDQAKFADRAVGPESDSGRGTAQGRPARAAVSAARRTLTTGAAGADCGGSRTGAGAAEDDSDSR